ncbi:prepilin peptidase [Glycomyces xiaoerkulensis]|uniref:prepilin peptidase n=1 Tax=Glycomyces xiaoerkulensis TaxID=2038139 RepID=UPI000C25D798|nr:prepilin peptidase [Glycomyces xiaoerkulensis]
MVVAAAAALLAVPGLRWCIGLAAARGADPRLLAAASLASALLIVWRAAGPLHLAALGLAAGCGIVAAWVDAYRRRLPDAMVLPVYPAAAALLLATGDPAAMLRAAACAAAGFALYLTGHALGQVGFGDVKLAGLLGLVLGWSSWPTAVVALVAAAVVGAVQAAVVLALRRREFPFGPAMFLGAAAALAVTPQIWALFTYYIYWKNRAKTRENTVNSDEGRI